MKKVQYYLQKIKHENCREELYIKSNSFTKERFVIPIEAFCIIYSYREEIADFFMTDFPLETKEKEIKEITKERYEKNLEIGKKFKERRIEAAKKKTFNP